MKYRTLFNYCRNGMQDRLVDTLSREDTDVLMHDYSLFKIAAKNRNTDILAFLISYYKEHNMKEEEIGTDTYLKAELKLREAIEKAIYAAVVHVDELPESLREVFGEYVPKRDDEDEVSVVPDDFEPDELNEEDLSRFYEDETDIIGELEEHHSDEEAVLSLGDTASDG